MYCLTSVRIDFVIVHSLFFAHQLMIEDAKLKLYSI